MFAHVLWLKYIVLFLLRFWRMHICQNERFCTHAWNLVDVALAFWLFTRLLLRFWPKTARAKTWCVLGAAPLGRSKNSTYTGLSGQKEARAILQPLSPAARCLLHPSPPASLQSSCLAVSLDSTNEWKCYRPNFQAGRYRYISLTKKLVVRIQQQTDCWGFRASRFGAGDSCTMTGARMSTLTVS